MMLISNHLLSNQTKLHLPPVDTITLIGSDEHIRSFGVRRFSLSNGDQ